jgi:membrane protein implicated in regulation of membrane protease activity
MRWPWQKPEQGLVGQQVRVCAAIPQDGTGEVMVDLAPDRGGSQAYPARSLDGAALPEGRLVYVAERSGRTLYVTAR